MPSEFYKQVGSHSVLFKMDRMVTLDDGEMMYILYDVDDHKLRTVRTEDLHNPDKFVPIPKVPLTKLKQVREYIQKFQAIPDNSSVADSNQNIEERPLELMGIYQYCTGDRFVYLGEAYTLPFAVADVESTSPSEYRSYIVLLDIQTGHLMLESRARFQHACRYDAEHHHNVPMYLYTYTKATLSGETSEQAVRVWLSKLLGTTEAAELDKETIGTASCTVSPDPDVDHPDYYGGDTPYETIKVLEAWYGIEVVQDFCLCNVLKYVSRLDKKASAEGMTDLRKARWYLDTLIELRERSEAKIRGKE